ncbi:Transposase [Anaerohalosphaera lusitana]|uniref:Transposase n=1 Tax=Anaerohalosphaera lusitana TaxID=1936003 RepID=A0A1U9NQP2_9BACT|nr:transposase [Anaerohalosphaera lusitana]AQT70229.1 Transposase [Anaerohalosphaera lusitana]
MPRQKRIAKGNIVYHVLNRANGRLRIFKKDDDFRAFEQILAEAAERFDMRICGYCIMSNHWHLVLWPRADGDLSAFMKWLTGTHSHRWHAAHRTVGIGHLYQGRYKSFPVQDDTYYLTLMRYVESNPLRAKLVKRSADYLWSSLANRLGKDSPLELSDGPMPLPRRWTKLVDGAADLPEDEIKTCIQRGRPFGDSDWTHQTAKALSLESSLRPRGRPRKTTPN